MEASVQDVRVRLEILIERVHTIRKLAESRSTVDQAAALFAELKEQLREEFRSMSTVKGQAKLSDAEQRWYYPTLHEAWAKNISPARSQHHAKWLSLPGEAEGEFSWTLSNLKSYIGE